ncbi:MAG: hypothetical protein K2X77_14845 [Candidatus Obscuribacterales bacterium]|nr:hypothetical protein [Candidatus Obscuribacterales bacterium]
MYSRNRKPAQNFRPKENLLAAFYRSPGIILMDATFSNENTGTGQLQQWLASMPAESLDRLTQINSHTGSAHHVILTLAYGLRDRYIGKLNRMIIGLLLRRMKAEREGNDKQVERINSYMKEMHELIDCVTGVNTAINGDRAACNRTKSGRRTILPNSH